MKALILAAGLGTRLMPLTADTPKALVTINGVTLLEIAIRKLVRAGFDEIVVNVHHHAAKIKDFIRDHTFPGTDIAISDESGLLLDTGGAILKARPFLEGSEPFLVHNVDVISNIDLHSLIQNHLKKNSLATLSIIDRKTRRYFLFDKDLKLAGWTDTSTGEHKWVGNPQKEARQLAFSGIHIVNPEIFSLFVEKGRFSIIDAYLSLAKKRPVFGYIQDEAIWFDVGKPEQLAVVKDFLTDHPEFI